MNDDPVGTRLLHLRAEPRPLGEPTAVIPPFLERLVHRCLAREPGARWQCAADLAFELHGMQSEGTGSRPAGPRDSRFGHVSSRPSQP
jgi:hypothetical protein